MKRITTFALFIVCTLTTAMAQNDAYTKELCNYFNTGWGNSAGQELGTEAYTEIFTALLNAKADKVQTPAEINSTAAMLAKKYNDEQATQDIAAIVAPIYKKHLTIDDLKEFNKLINSDKKLYDAGNKLGSKEIISEMTTALSQSIMSSMMKIAQGEKPELLLTAEEKQDKLYLAVEDYCKSCGISKMITGSFGQALANMAGNEQQTKIMMDCIEYVTQEIPSFYYKSAKGKVTEEEFKYVTKFYKTPLGQKLVAGTVDVMSNPMLLGEELMTKISEWLDKQEF